MPCNPTHLLLRPVAVISLVMGTNLFSGASSRSPLQTVVRAPSQKCLFEILHCWFKHLFLINTVVVKKAICYTAPVMERYS